MTFFRGAVILKKKICEQNFEHFSVCRLSRIRTEISIETNINHTCNSNEDCERKANQEYHEDQDKMSF